MSVWQQVAIGFLSFLSIGAGVATLLPTSDKMRSGFGVLILTLGMFFTVVYLWPYFSNNETKLIIMAHDGGTPIDGMKVYAIDLGAGGNPAPLPGTKLTDDAGKTTIESVTFNKTYEIQAESPQYESIPVSGPRVDITRTNPEFPVVVKRKLTVVETPNGQSQATVIPGPKEVEPPNVEFVSSEVTVATLTAGDLTWDSLIATFQLQNGGSNAWNLDIANLKAIGYDAQNNQVIQAFLDTERSAALVGGLRDTRITLEPDENASIEFKGAFQIFDLEAVQRVRRWEFTGPAYENPSPWYNPFSATRWLEASSPQAAFEWTPAP